ncbi:MAG TPA: hypothetical protein VHW69_01140 [Rhizomicrobium sp.]|nr:hypothetical protein [Rhizomicrobium sp.]
MKMVSSAMQITGRFCNAGSGFDDWLQSSTAYEEAVKAAVLILKTHTPHYRFHDRRIRDGTGEAIAEAVLKQIREQKTEKAGEKKQEA